MTQPSSPAAPVAPDRKRVLHVGCGPPNPMKLNPVFRGGGWEEVRLDIDPAVAPDIVASITAMPMIADASIDAVWSSHNLEHLYEHEVVPTLREFLRVLKPGGFFLVTMPDLQAVAAVMAEDDGLDRTLYTDTTGTVPITPLDIVYGWGWWIAQGRTAMAHRTGFSMRSLARKLVEAGFHQAQVIRGPVFSLWGMASKGEPIADTGLLTRAMA